MAAVILDLASFAEPGFEPAAWLNAATRERAPDEPLDRFLSELEMRLQLLAEDVGAALEESSAGSLLRIPRALAEIDRVRDDALSLQAGMASILQRLEPGDSAAARSVAVLAGVDVVQRRVAAAAETLAQAAGLADMFSAVEKQLAQGDLRRVAGTLAAMRRSLTLVADVPEFADGDARLAALEARLEAAVQPALTAALIGRDGPAAAELAAILQALGREELLHRCLAAAIEPPAMAAFERAVAAGAAPAAAGGARGSAAGGAAASGPGPAAALDAWLGNYLEDLLASLSTHARWLSRALPSHHPSLLLRGVATLFEAKLGAPMAKRLEAATAQAGAAAAAAGGSGAGGGGAGGPDGLGRDEAAGGALAVLAAAASVLGAFTRGLLAVLPPAGAGPIAVAAAEAAVRSIYAPLEVGLSRYGELETSCLGAQLTAHDLSAAGGTEPAARRLAALLPALSEALAAAAERCGAVTGGVEAEGLLMAAESAVGQQLGRVGSLLAALRQQAGLEEEEQAGAAPGTSEAGGGGEAGGDPVAGAVALLAAAHALGGRLADADRQLVARLRALASSLGPLLPPAGGTPVESALAASGGGTAGPAAALHAAVLTGDLTAVRLATAPDRARRLAALLSAAAEPRYRALPRGRGRAAAVATAARSLASELALGRVRALLRGVSALPLWAQASEASAAAFDLPVFSAYPADYMTAVGECLLALPQQLEHVAWAAAPQPGAAAGAEEEEADAGAAAGGGLGGLLAGEWLAEVGTAAAGLVSAELLRVRTLADRGAAQMAADLEYLANVLAALSVPVPAGLATLSALAALPAEGFGEAVAEGLAGGAADAAVAATVARMRGLQLEA